MNQPKTPVAAAIETITAAMQNDSSYAWAWQCNVAMMAVDSGVSHKMANEGAARFMQLAFGVDVRQFDAWKSLERGWHDRRVHPDDVMVNNLADTMKKRMAQKRAEGFDGWTDASQCPASRLAEKLVESLRKGRLVDVANFAGMLVYRGDGGFVHWNAMVASPDEHPAGLDAIKRAQGSAETQMNSENRELASFARRMLAHLDSAVATVSKLHPDFDAIRDKRMSEMTPAQREDAKELWIREQIGHMDNYHRPHMEFLLRRIDDARGASVQMPAPKFFAWEEYAGPNFHPDGMVWKFATHVSTGPRDKQTCLYTEEQVRALLGAATPSKYSFGSFCRSNSCGRKPCQWIYFQRVLRTIQARHSPGWRPRTGPI